MSMRAWRPLPAWVRQSARGGGLSGSQRHSEAQRGEACLPSRAVLSASNWRTLDEQHTQWLTGPTALPPKLTRSVSRKAEACRPALIGRNGWNHNNDKTGRSITGALLPVNGGAGR